MVTGTPSGLKIFKRGSASSLKTLSLAWPHIAVKMPQQWVPSYSSQGLISEYTKIKQPGQPACVPPPCTPAFVSPLLKHNTVLFRAKGSLNLRWLLFRPGIFHVNPHTAVIFPTLPPEL